MPQELVTHLLQAASDRLGAGFFLENLSQQRRLHRDERAHLGLVVKDWRAAIVARRTFLE